MVHAARTLSRFPTGSEVLGLSRRWETAVTQQGIGAPVRRKEDRRFLTGRGRYVADRAPAGELHAVFLRSPYARAGVAVTTAAPPCSSPAWSRC